MSEELTEAELALLSEGTVDTDATEQSPDATEQATVKEWVNEEERKAFVRERIIACIKEGKSVNQVVAETGASVVHVKQLFKKLNIDWRTVPDLVVKIEENYAPDIEEELSLAEQEAEVVHTGKPSITKLIKQIRDIYHSVTPLRSIRLRFYKDKAVSVLTNKTFTPAELQQLKLSYMLIRPIPCSINNNRAVFEFHKEILQLFEK